MIIERYYCDWCKKELEEREKEQSILFRIDLCLDCRKEANKALMPAYKKCSSNLKTTDNIRQQNVRKNNFGETTQLDSSESSIVTDEHIPADSSSKNLNNTTENDDN